MGNAATANSGDGGKAAAAKAAADLPDFTIELDKSRVHSEVHGEHAFNLGFIQDKLPFDKGARLIRELFGKPGFEQAKAIHDRKIKALETAFAQAAQVTDEDTGNKAGPTEAIVEDPDADVNLRMWAMGKARYMPLVIYRVIRARYGRHVGTLAEAKAYLVEIKVVAQGEVV
jgi:hypothetical protein